MEVTALDMARFLWADGDDCIVLMLSLAVAYSFPRRVSWRKWGIERRQQQHRQINNRRECFVEGKTEEGLGGGGGGLLLDSKGYFFDSIEPLN